MCQSPEANNFPTCMIVPIRIGIFKKRFDEATAGERYRSFTHGFIFPDKSESYDKAPRPDEALPVQTTRELAECITRSLRSLLPVAVDCRVRFVDDDFVMVFDGGEYDQVVHIFKGPTRFFIIIGTSWMKPGRMEGLIAMLHEAFWRGAALMDNTKWREI